jgi:predicted membrane channel-forming protein YqfA (hemolysin III family)
MKIIDHCLIIVWITVAILSFCLINNVKQQKDIIDKTIYISNL